MPFIDFGVKTKGFSSSLGRAINYLESPNYPVTHYKSRLTDTANAYRALGGAGIYKHTNLGYKDPLMAPLLPNHVELWTHQRNSVVFSGPISDCPLLTEI